MKISKIYVDMDGVLCNFEKRYNELYGNIRDQDRRTQFRPNFDEFIATNQFATLDAMPDFHMLRAYLDILDVPKQILSSTAYEKTFETISRQKKEWLGEHNIFWPDPIFVPGKRHKYKFAQPDTVIIDDTYSVIEDWRNAGGIAIWHKDAKNTIMDMESLFRSA
jgi:hypothetical protein